MSEPAHSPSRSEAGFTIIEAMVASALLLVGLVTMLGLVDRAASTTRVTRVREQATALQRELVEGARAIAYDQLTPAGAAAAIRTRPALDDASGAQGWSIRRRNTTYTVAVGVCTVDDPRDGSGQHTPGVFCADAAGPSVDSNGDGTLDGLASSSTVNCTTGCDPTPADYKRLVSKVTWPGGESTQSAQINSPGLSAAPAVLTLGVASTVTDPATTSLPVSATTTGNASQLSLFADGAFVGAGTGGPTSWNGAWALRTDPSASGLPAPFGQQPAQGELVDGSYELSAKAFDAYDQYGVSKTQVVVVNRRLAFAPARVEAGRNGDVVEVEWSPAKERDSLGFRVDRRTANGAWTPVCPRALTTRCRDSAPPSGRIEYSVVGYDSDPNSGQPRPGDQFVDAFRDSKRFGIAEVLDPPPAVPGAPPTLSASRNGSSVTLSWTAPAGATPDHYNLYRDGAAYDDRLASVYITPGKPLSYTDATTLQTHSYRLTAVNDALGESPMTGPVTG